MQVDTKTGGVPIKALLFGTLVAYAITCIAFVICAILLRYTSFGDNSVPMLVTVTCVIAVLVSGFDTARGAERDGWLWGLVAGGVYAVLWIIFGILFTRSIGFDMRTLTIIMLCVAGGGLGGMLGINFRK